MKNLDKDIEKVLIDAVKIQERICEMGAQITKDYEGRELVLVGVLKGAMPFLCDLMRAIDLPLTIDTMVVSSYGNDTVSSGSIHIRKDLDKEIQGKNVLVVEDIIDTGITLSLLVPLLSVKYVGFDVPDEFIVGYGCDYAEKYRNLPAVCTLKSKVYTRT